MKKVLKDSEVRCVWQGTDEYGNKYTIEVTPDWYEDNGTPIDDGGEDMKYLHTYIETK